VSLAVLKPALNDTYYHSIFAVSPNISGHWGWIKVKIRGIFKNDEKSEHKSKGMANSVAETRFQRFG